MISRTVSLPPAAAPPPLDRGGGDVTLHVPPVGASRRKATPSLGVDPVIIHESRTPDWGPWRRLLVIVFVNFGISSLISAYSAGRPSGYRGGRRRGDGAPLKTARSARGPALKHGTGAETDHGARDRLGDRLGESRQSWVTATREDKNLSHM